MQFNPNCPSKRAMNEETVVGFEVGETEEADVGAKSVVWVEV